MDTSTNPNTVSTIPWGDYDDLLLFTVRSPDTPYRGKFGGTAVESNTAEVLWYCRDGMTFAGVKTYNLCRRQLLVVPDAVLQATNPAAATFSTNTTYRQGPKPELKRVSSPTLLATLPKRENRFMHGTTIRITPTLPVSAPRFRRPARARKSSYRTCFRSTFKSLIHSQRSARTALRYWSRLTQHIKTFQPTQIVLLAELTWTWGTSTSQGFSDE